MLKHILGTFVFVFMPVILPLIAQETNKQSTPKAYGQIARLDDWVTAVGWSADGRLLAIGTYELTLIWDRETRKVIQKIPAKSGYVRAVLFTPDDKLIYTGCYQSIELFDVLNGKRLLQFKGHGTDITRLAWCNSGATYASSSKDRHVHLWDINKTSPVQTVKFEQPVYDFQISRDKQILAVALGDETRVTLPGQVEIVELKSGKSVLNEKLPEQARYASSILFSTDEKYIISGSNDTKGYVYDVSAEKATGFFGGHKRPINGMVLIPDSTTVISVSGGRTKGKNELKAWDYVSGDELASFEPHTDIVNCVALSPDKKLLATGGQDKTAIIWDLSTIIKLNDHQQEKAKNNTSEHGTKYPVAPSLPE